MAPVRPACWGEAALTPLGASAARHGWTVGHAKVAVDTGGRITKLSLVDASRVPVADLDATPYPPAPAPSARPSRVDHGETGLPASWNPDFSMINVGGEAAAGVVAAADAATGTVSTADAAPPSFAPPYPTPTHRLPA